LDSGSSCEHQRGGTPRWDSRQFPKADRAGRLIALASGDPEDAARFKDVAQFLAEDLKTLERSK